MRTLCFCAALIGLAAMNSSAANDGSCVVIYDGIATEISAPPVPFPTTNATDLWVKLADLKRATRFELKPEGVCRDELCFPIPAARKQSFLTTNAAVTWFNLGEFARLLHQPAACDAEAAVWYFGPRAAEQNSYLNSLAAPDFTLPDMQGTSHSLSDFRGKKVLLVTWASWCGCRFDLPAWQAFYHDLKDRNFEIVSVAEDTGGVKDAGPSIEKAKPEYTVLIDTKHIVTRRYNMVNVPTAVWINEQGRIVRPNEVAYSSNQLKPLHGLDAAPYLDAIRDWVAKGEQSAFALSEPELKARLTPPPPEWALAAAEFGLAEHCYRVGETAASIRHYKEAQRLNPESWNYKRQAWALADAERDYGTSFSKEVKKLNGKPYYAPRRLPEPKKPD